MVESEVDHVEAAVPAHRGGDGLGQKAASSVGTLPAQKAFFGQNLLCYLTGGRRLTLKCGLTSFKIR